MASETKVGLLAGLAFIVCFAVILANRGRHEMVSPHLLQLADGRGEVSQATQPPGVPSAPSRGDGGVSRDFTGSGSTASSGEWPGSGPGRVERAGDGFVSVVRPDAPEAVTRSWNSRSASRGVGSALPSDASAERVPSEGTEGTAWLPERQGRDPSAERAVLQKRLDELSARAAPQARPSTKSSGPGAAADAEDRAGSSPGAGRSAISGPARCVVASGDTLSKIAQRYYRSQSRRIIDAIFDANRSSLASPDEIRVGLELVLPTIDGVGAPAAVAPPSKPEGAHPAGDPRNRVRTPGPEPRWYQIRKNDRYVSIARTQLGDESRWREIYELNKDKFPDPGRIREGVRIKLPMTGVAVLGEGRP